MALSIFGDKDTIFIIWGIHLGFKKHVRLFSETPCVV